MFAYCLNNPVLYHDSLGTDAVTTVPSSGFWEFLLGFSWILCWLDGFLPIGDVIYYTVLGLELLACTATLTASQAQTEEKTEIQVMTVAPDKDDGTVYTVYFLYAANDPNKAIIYVGRVKSANFTSRMRYHASQNRLPSARIDGLTYAECRFVEQAGMIYFHTIGRGEPYKNQIRGIGPNNKALEIYLEAGRNLNDGRLPKDFVFPNSYFANFIENELLNGWS